MDTTKTDMMQYSEIIEVQITQQTERDSRNRMKTYDMITETSHIKMAHLIKDNINSTGHLLKKKAAESVQIS